MKELLQHKTARVSKTILDRKEECGVSGSFTLPDYCADIATVMMCAMTPHLQNRQWSGDRLLVDGSADVHVLYLDEERCRVHSAEFALPFNVECKADYGLESLPVSVDLDTKYVNWRVISPRCIEIRGAVALCIQALSVDELVLREANQSELESRVCAGTITAPACATEKVITVSEQLEFPQNNPAAEMLLGGDCNAEITDCRILLGKAIVKGKLHVHQLYTDDSEKGTTHCLDYVIPYSQILDLDGAKEGQLYQCKVSCLSDVERCLVGAEGENTVLDVTAKLLLQLSIWDKTEVSFLQDVYHTRHPITIEHCEFEHRAYVGCRCETVMLPLPIDLPSKETSEIIDVRVAPMSHETTVRGNQAVVNGKLCINVLWRDCDRQIGCYIKNEDFRIELPCVGDRVVCKLQMTDTQYHTDGTHLQLQIRLGCSMDMYQDCKHTVVTGVQLCEQESFETDNVNLLMYYAGAGESVWDIGRSCHASVGRIYEENELTDDTIKSPTLLTIPL